MNQLYQSMGHFLDRWPKAFVPNMLIILLMYVLWALCYPPLPLGPLVLILFAVIWKATESVTAKQAFGMHFVGGIFFNLISYYWIVEVIKVGPMAIILLGLLLMVTFFASLNAYMGLMYHRVRTLPFGMWIYTAVWVGFEVLRTKGQMSFPWSHLGYTLGNQIWLLQIASVVGVFGIGLLILLCNVLAYRFLFGHSLISGVLFVVLCCLWMGSGWLRIQESDHSTKKNEIVRLALVQPSIEQTNKWDEAYFNHVMEQTYRLLGPANIDSTDLIVLAETAVPSFLRRRVQELRTFRQVVKDAKSTVLVGSLDFEQTGNAAWPYHYYNSAFLFRTNNDSLLKYDKVRLVPFSEKLPFNNFFPILNFVDLGQANFSAGKEAVVWTEPVAFSPSICYEVVYPDYFRRAKQKGARLLVNITNDGWFGRSIAPYQHANISKFRSIEVGLPLARCANSGISMFVDVYGRVSAKTKLMEQTVLRQNMILESKSTIWTSIGDSVEWILFGIWAVVQIYLLIPRRK